MFEGIRFAFQGGVVLSVQAISALFAAVAIVYCVIQYVKGRVK